MTSSAVKPSRQSLVREMNERVSPASSPSPPQLASVAQATPRHQQDQRKEQAGPSSSSSKAIYRRRSNSSSGHSRSSLLHQSRSSGHSRSPSPRSHPPPPIRHRSSRSSSNERNGDRLAGRFTSICIKNLNVRLSGDQLHDAIVREFRRFGQFNVRIVNNKKSSPSQDDRIAFVNFYAHEDAREAKRLKMNQSLCGYPMYIEPVFKNGRRSPPPNYRRSRSPPSFDRRNSTRRAASPIPPPPPPHRHEHVFKRSRSPESMGMASSSTRLARVTRSPSPKLSSAPKGFRRSPAANISRNSSNYETSPLNRSDRISGDKDDFYRRVSPLRKGGGGNHQRSPPPPPSRSHSNNFHNNNSKSLYRGSSPASRVGSIASIRRRSNSPPLHGNRYSYNNKHHHGSVPQHHVTASRRSRSPYDLAYQLLGHNSRSRSPQERCSARNGRANNFSPPSSRYGHHYHMPPPSSGPPSGPGGVSHYFDDDERDATRTLFIGNLDPDVSEKHLRRLFEKFGSVEDIDIKRNMSVNQSASTAGVYGRRGDTGRSEDRVMKKTYAFVKFDILDMAVEAKQNMDGKMIGANEVKIGYGKPTPTRCLWVGGLDEQSTQEDLHTAVRRAIGSSVAKFDIVWLPADRKRRHRRHRFEHTAYIELDSSRDADDVRNDLRGRPIATGMIGRLRVDYVEPRHLESMRRHERKKAAKQAATSLSSTTITNSAQTDRSNNEDDNDESNNESGSDSGESCEESESSAESTTSADQATKPNTTNEQRRLRRPHFDEETPDMASLENSEPKRRREDSVSGSNSCEMEERLITKTSNIDSNVPIEPGNKTTNNFENIRITTSVDNNNHRRVNAIVNHTVIMANQTTINSSAAKLSPCEERVQSSTTQSTSSENKQQQQQSNRIVSLKDPKQASIESHLTDSVSATDVAKSAQSATQVINEGRKNGKLSESIMPNESGGGVSNISAEGSISNEKNKLSAIQKTSEVTILEQHSAYAFNATKTKISSPSSSSSLIKQTNTTGPLRITKNDNVTTTTPPLKLKPPQDDSIMAVTPPPKSSSDNGQPEVTTIETDEDHDEGEIVDELEKALIVRDSKVASLRKPVISAVDLSRALNSIWSGLLVLKKNLFRTKFYLLAGSEAFALNNLNLLNKRANPNLQINQRIRVDSPKIEDLEKSLLSSSPLLSSTSSAAALSLPDSYSVLLALPFAETGRESEKFPNGHLQHNMSILINYLDQKQAAGLISLPEDIKPFANLNIFSSGSNFAKRVISQLLPDIPIPQTADDSDYLIMVLLKCQPTLSQNNTS